MINWLRSLVAFKPLTIPEACERLQVLRLKGKLMRNGDWKHHDKYIRIQVIIGVVGISLVWSIVFTATNFWGFAWVSVRGLWNLLHLSWIRFRIKSVMIMKDYGCAKCYERFISIKGLNIHWSKKHKSR